MLVFLQTFGILIFIWTLKFGTPVEKSYLISLLVDSEISNLLQELTDLTGEHDELKEEVKKIEVDQQKSP